MNKDHGFTSFYGAMALAVLMLFGAGCASTTPTAKFKQPLSSTARLAAGDTVKATVNARAGIDILEIERMRIAQRIEQCVKAKQAANPAHAEQRAYSVELTLTKYDKGNAFARAMLAGLGQIHIEATVEVYQLPERLRVTEFDLKKTFAWGGLYGGTTSIEDIERTFAEGIAATLTGQAEESPKTAQADGTKPSL